MAESIDKADQYPAEAPAPLVPGISAGYTLGRYTIIEPLGAGGMGSVFRARDEKLERIVAIKVLHPRWG